MDLHLIAYFIGIALVFITHAAMLWYHTRDMMVHAIINLVASALIAYYFMHREGYIRI